MKYRSKVFNSVYKTERVIRLAKTGAYSAPYLAKIFGCNKKTVFKILQANEITLPNLGRFEKKIYCNERFFLELNPISAYWAGFIAADGALSERDKSIAISLNKRDKAHLYKFINAIKTNARIGNISSNSSVRMAIYSRPLYESLLKLGIGPNKSLNIGRIKMPRYLESHFIRGVFDGDGWISGRKITHVQLGIAGNRPFLRQIQDTLVKKCGINRVKLYLLPQSGRACKLQYTGSQIFRILDFLYRDSSRQIRLDRKRQKLLEIRRRLQVNDASRN